jgi:8-hydroxy-5-deazaflavin:NADPH oxidoreductase
MSRKIGVVGGTGPEGSGLAKRWAAAGEHIVIGSRDAARAAETAKLLRQRLGPAAMVEGGENSAVISICDIIVLAVPFAGQAALLKQLKPAWKPGQILIDTTVPLAAAAGGSASRMLGVWQGSAAQQVRELVPELVGVAAAFHHLSAELLARDGPVDCDVLVCSDDEEAKRVAGELAEKISGARAVNGGKLENARIVESMTALLIGLNTRYKTRIAGIRFTGLPR